MNGPFWSRWVRNVVLPDLAVLRESVLDRAVPAFDGIEDEADKAAEEALERLGAAFHPDHDPADMYEAAHEAGVDYYLRRDAARQAVLNLFVVALHHFVDQQLLFLLRRELLPKRNENDSQFFTRRAVVAALQMQAIDLEAFPEWVKLEELRLAANVAKHADGSSADQLRVLRLELFQPAIIRSDPSSRLRDL